MSQSPPVQVDLISVPRGEIYVVRDDLLQGGTKQRAAIPFIQDLEHAGFRDFVYASPFCGFAQVALAAACQAVGVRCTLFCERDRSLAVGAVKLHEFSRLAASFGAEVILVEDLAAATRAAALYARKTPDSTLVPLGFDCEEFRTHLRREIEKQWKIVVEKVGPRLNCLWLPVGSGTLAMVFHSVISKKIPIRAVNVHVLKSEDHRISRVSGLSGLTMTGAPERFADRARVLPPVDSNIHYDAKLWNFIREDGNNGDVWWNVAR